MVALRYSGVMGTGSSRSPRRSGIRLAVKSPPEYVTGWASVYDRFRTHGARSTVLVLVL